MKNGVVDRALGSIVGSIFALVRAGWTREEIRGEVETAIDEAVVLAKERQVKVTGASQRPSQTPDRTGRQEWLSDAEIEVVVSEAVAAARRALSSSIGSSSAAYDKVDRFMEVFESELRGRLREQGAISV